LACGLQRRLQTQLPIYLTIGKIYPNIRFGLFHLDFVNRAS
jgi:hypothetical protein